MESHQADSRWSEAISTTVVGPTLSSPWRAPDRNTYGSSAQPTPMSGGEDGRGRGRR